MIDTEKIPGPVVEIDIQRAKQNIQKMLAKARKNSAELRPHFKTHQSHTVAGWYREAGVNRCTVSSPLMAEYFVEDGWDDILIAFPAQPGAIATYNRLSKSIRLGLIGDSMFIIDELESGLDWQVDFWVEVDAGYGRTGVRWDDIEKLKDLCSRAEACTQLNFRGLLCHAGDSYSCRGAGEIEELFRKVRQRLEPLLTIAESQLGRKVELSYGDTPTCSICDDFALMDELRPGNFVFYDLMQHEIGACRIDDITLALACPVVGIYPERNEVVIHGGGVHFSKERMGEGVYGQVFVRDDNGRCQIVHDAVLAGLSQEHGVISAPLEWMESLQVGDVVRVLPVHSCLVMECMRGECAEEPRILYYNG